MKELVKNSSRGVKNLDFGPERLAPHPQNSARGSSMKAAVATHSYLVDESYGHIPSQAHQWLPTRDYHNHGWPLGALLGPHYTAPQMHSTQEAVR